MQNTQLINKDEIKAILFGLLHSTIIPALCIYKFSWFGLFYLLIPTVMYLTLKKDGKGRDWFFILLFIYFVILVAGFVDNSSTGGLI